MANQLFERRKRRVRFKIRQHANGKPRISVFRSGKHIYAQLIDDANGVTIASASSIDKEIRGDLKNGGNKDAAQKVGSLLAKRALEKKVTACVFDRGAYLFHGRVKSLADAAREAGLQF
jgi:large subunit ribosomal protein L18